MNRLLRPLPSDPLAALAEAWSRTEAVFGCLDAALAGGSLGEWTRIALLAQPVADWPPFLYLLGHLPARAARLLAGPLGGRSMDDPETAALEALFAPEWGASHQPGEDRLPDVADVLRFRYRLHGWLRAELRGAPKTEALRAAIEGALAVELDGQQALLSMAQALPLGALRVPPLDGGPRQGAAAGQGSVAGQGPAERVALPATPLPGLLDRPAGVVPAFALRRAPVTVGDWQAFVAAGGYADARLWEAAAFDALQGRAAPRTWRRRPNGAWMVRLPLHELDLHAAAALPVQVDGHEAAAYARFEGGRLPTADELRAAAAATTGGDAPPGVTLFPPGVGGAARPPGVEALRTAGWTWSADGDGAGGRLVVGGPWVPEGASAGPLALRAFAPDSPWHQTQVRVAWST